MDCSSCEVSTKCPLVTGSSSCVMRYLMVIGGLTPVDEINVNFPKLVHNSWLDGLGEITTGAIPLENGPYCKPVSVGSCFST